MKMWWRSAVRVLIGYAIGVSVAFAVLIFSLNTDFALQLPDFSRNQGNVIAYPAKAFGRTGVKPEQSTHIAKYEQYFADNPANFEPLEEYPSDYAFRNYDNSVGLLDLAFRKSSNNDLVNGSCTASIISPEYLLTAYHCISQKAHELVAVEFQFGFLSEEGGARRFPVEITPIEGNNSLDYAVLRVDFSHELKAGDIDAGVEAQRVLLDEGDRPDVSPIRLGTYAPTEGSRLFIIHHPMKQPMVVTSHSCFVLGEAAVLADDEKSWRDERKNTIRHLCDTLIGSSGAPLIELDRDVVVGLHIRGALGRKATERDANRAVRIDRIAYHSRSEGEGIVADLVEPRPLTSENRRAASRLLSAAQTLFSKGDYKTAAAMAAVPIVGHKAKPENAGYAVPFELKELERMLIRSSRLDWHAGSITTNTALETIALGPDTSRAVVAGRRGDAGIISRNSDGALELVGNTSKHEWVLTDAAYSPDGEKIATSSFDETIILHDANDGATIREFTGHTSVVSDIEFSPDGVLLASISSDSTAKLWDVATGAIVASFDVSLPDIVVENEYRPLHAGVRFDDSGKFLAIWSDEGGIKFADVQSLKIFDALLTDFSILDFSFSLIGTAAFTGKKSIQTGLDEFRQISETIVYDLERQEQSLSIMHTEVSQVSALSNDGWRLITSSTDEIQLWDISEGSSPRLVGQYNGGGSELRWARFLPNSDLFLSHSDDEMIAVWRADADSPVKELYSFGQINDVEFDSDGNTIAVASDWGVDVWNLTSSLESRPLESNINSVAYLYEAGHTGDYVVAGYPGIELVAGDTENRQTSFVNLERVDGPRVVYVAATSKTGRVVLSESDLVIDFVDQNRIGYLPNASPYVGGDRARAAMDAALSPIGDSLAKAYSSGAIVLYSWLNGMYVERLKLDAHVGSAIAVEYDPDGEFLVSAGEDKSIRVWRVSDGEKIAEFSEFESALTSTLRFLPDGSGVVGATTDGRYYILNFHGRRQLALRAFTDPDLEFSPRVWEIGFEEDGTTLYFLTDEGRFHLLDVNNATLLTSSSFVNDVAYLKNDKIALAIDNGWIEIIDSTLGSQTRRFTAGSADVVQIEGVKDDSELLSMDRRGTFALWSVKKPEGLIDVVGVVDGPAAFLPVNNDKEAIVASHGEAVVFNIPETGETQIEALIERSKRNGLLSVSETGYSVLFGQSVCIDAPGFCGWVNK